MKVLSRTLAIVLSGVMLVLGACGGGDGGSSSPTAAQAGVYISLGDSVAAGSGASDAAETSFPAVVAQETDLELKNLAADGATISDVYSNQLPQIAGAVGGREVALITVSAGGNDLAGLIPNTSCQEDPLPSTCPLNDTLFAVAQQLGFLVDELRAAYPEVPIVLLAYPNFFSNTGHPFEAPAARVLPQLERVVGGVVNSHLAGNIAVATPSFDGQGDTLTHVLDDPSDPHPNDAGHEVIAAAVLEAFDQAK
jgi:lysophospholipase L1-like esterase